MLELFLNWGLPILGTALTGLVVTFLRKKMNLTLTSDQEKIIGDILKKSIGYAEEWARKQIKAKSAGLPDVGVVKTPAPNLGPQKLEVAIDFAKQELKRAKIDLNDDQVNQLLHSALGMLR
jgi:hypothetical protein